MMADGTPRVVLLARPGEACQRLDAALREAGAEIALIADPATVAPGTIVELAPQAILVALEPAVEDALERFESLLSDPQITVIFDEAELAAQREGWDAARWVRHLAAKLRSDDDVLPPGWELDDGDRWQPAPGPLPTARAEIGELDIATFAGEARALAAEVPRDDGFDTLDAFAAAPQDADAAPDVAAGDRGMAVADSGEHPGERRHEEQDDEQDLASVAFDTSGIVAAEDMDWSSSAEFSVSLDDAELEHLQFEAVTDDDDDGDDTFAGGDAPALQLDDTGLDAADFADSADSVDSLHAADTATPAAAARGSFGGTLSLADDDAPPAAAAGGARVERDLGDIERRLSGLSLVDPDSYGFGPLRGAVLVEGGLGGPDAVRQLLAEIPETFPRPILVRLQLDGGRYDRLVKQMERAARMPVALAESGQTVDPGTVYFLSPSMGLRRDRAHLVFAEDAVATLHAELPASDCALLFLSGSDAALVDGAIAKAGEGALVAAQSPETCYDGAAAAALIALGGTAGAPNELAERIVERWPS